MSITYLEADICEATQNLILHGCNCFTTMGAGVARAIKEKWPEVYITDTKTKWGDHNKLGTFSTTQVGNHQHVLNCYTQFRYGRGKQLSLVALDKCFAAIAKTIGDRNLSIAMPYLGCGLAGDSWKLEVEPLVQKHFSHLDVVVYYL